ncbi:MAG: DUF2974 domain-containing protein [Clostridia bacterium]|nr:DUF2974 domain-containing protein [Clostridia bacterium]
MANMMDYLLWRGDLSLAQAPWCNVDSLVMASFCYIKMGELPADDEISLHDLALTLPLMEQEGSVQFRQWRSLFYAMADSRRYGSMVLHDYVDITNTEEATQFSAVTCDLEDGTAFVCFRGTDSTLVGWREDFDMSYSSPVPAQTMASEYLSRMIAQTGKKIRTSGHSKGGNLAAYAAAHLTEQEQQQLISVCSFDGPGLDDITLASDGYKRILPILTSVIPESSVVGLLMGYSENYTVVEAESVSLLQHDAFKWHLRGPDFMPAELNASSRIIDEALHTWLKEESVEDRKMLVEAMFEIAESTKAETVADFKKDILTKLSAIVSAHQNMDPEKKKNAQQLLGRILSLSASTAWDSLKDRVRDTVGEAGSKVRDTIGGVGSTLRDTVEEAGKNVIRRIRQGDEAPEEDSKPDDAPKGIVGEGE